MNSKISDIQEELIHENHLALSPLGNSEGSEFRPVCSPGIDGSRNYLHPQIFHNASCSPFRPLFSSSKYSEHTPIERRIGNGFMLSQSPLDPMIDNRLCSKKSGERNISSFFRLDLNTEFAREQPFSFQVQAVTEGIEKVDYQYLRGMIGKTTTKPRIEKAKEEKSQKLKTRIKMANKNSPQEVKRKTKPFKCKYCDLSFSKAQALGGHMSRTHPGESREYRQKKVIRKNRKLERIKLLLAKKKFFQSLNYDYSDLLKTPEGKMRARTLINRTRIKKLKRTLTKEELEEFVEEEYIDDIST